MLVYSILTYLLSPVILGHIIWVSIKNTQSRYFWQRLGFKYSDLPPESLWFHCASVGEVNTILPLLENINKKNNQLTIIITTNTVTGAQIVAQQQLDYLFHCYLPFDWKFSVNRFLNADRPESVYIVETEIWPCLFTSCFNNNKPVTLINARLSKKTTTANKWIKSVLKQALTRTKAIYARSDQDRCAFLELGAPKTITSVEGNLKLTTILNSTPQLQPVLIDREYVILASTHKDEELLFYNIWKTLNRDELLIIAPRHPERSRSIIKQLNVKNIAVRSKNGLITKKTEVYLLDTVGELKNYYPESKLVVMGGSFVPTGGHNILEPASFHKAIITGPYMDNFSEELTMMQKYNAIIQATSQRELKIQLQKALEENTFRNSVIENTRNITSNLEHVLDNYLKLIIPDE